MPNWGVRLKRNPLYLALASLAAVLVFFGALFDSVTMLGKVADWTQGRFFRDEYEADYQALAKLIPGAPVEVARLRWGEPTIRGPLRIEDPTSPLAKYSQWTYSRKGFFVRLFVDSDGVIRASLVQRKDGSFFPPLPKDLSRCADSCPPLGKASFASVADRQGGAGLFYGQAHLVYQESFGTGHILNARTVVLAATNTTNSGIGAVGSAPLYDELLETFQTHQASAEPGLIDIGGLRSRLRPNVLFIGDARTGNATDQTLTRYVSGFLGLRFDEVLLLDSCSVGQPLRRGRAC